MDTSVTQQTLEGFRQTLSSRKARGLDPAEVWIEADATSAFLQTTAFTLANGRLTVVLLEVGTRLQNVTLDLAEAFGRGIWPRHSGERSGEGIRARRSGEGIRCPGAAPPPPSRQTAAREALPLTEESLTFRLPVRGLVNRRVRLRAPPDRTALRGRARRKLLSAVSGPGPRPAARRLATDGRTPMSGYVWLHVEDPKGRRCRVSDRAIGRPQKRDEAGWSLHPGRVAKA